MYRHHKTAGYLTSSLRRRLSDELGGALATWRRTAWRTSSASRAGGCRAFLAARAEILEHLAARGEHSARAAQIATLQGPGAPRTTPSRPRCAPTGGARRGARPRPPRRRPGGRGGPPSRESPSQALAETARLGDRLASRGVDGGSGRAFTRRRRGCRRRRGATDAPPSPGRGAADRFLARASSVRAEVVGGERRYTPTSCSTSSAACSTAPGPPWRGTGSADETRARRRGRARRSLSEEQREARRLASPQRRLRRSPWRAAAGTGKTSRWNAARRRGKASGVPVSCARCRARRRGELRDRPDSTPPPCRLRQALNRKCGVGAGSLLISTRRGVSAPATSPAGDAAEQARPSSCSRRRRQLPEIEAGGASTPSPNAPRCRAAGGGRQLELWMRRPRRPQESWTGALRREYQHHGRGSVAAPTAEHARAALVEDGGSPRARRQR